MDATIRWFDDNVMLAKRVYLFCFGGRCLSGMISAGRKN